MNIGRENRRSFCIKETVYLKYEVISDREFHKAWNGEKYASARAAAFDRRSSTWMRA